MYRNKVGGTIFGIGPNKTWEKIRSNNLIRGLFTLFVIAIVVLVVYLIYQAIQKNVKDKNLITCRSPPKGCLLESGIHNLGKVFPPSKSKHLGIGSSDGSALPKSLSKNEFSINVWLYTPSGIWIKPKDGSSWYNILKGTRSVSKKATESQPSVWLHPITNRLLIRWTTTGEYVEPVGCGDAAHTKLIKETCKLPENDGRKFKIGGETFMCSKMCHPSGKVKRVAMPLDLDYAYMTEALDPNGATHKCPVEIENSCCGGGGDTCQVSTSYPLPYPMNVVSQACVQNLPLDRWFLLSIIVREQSADIYIDGKIVRSVVFSKTIDASPEYITMGSSALNPFHAQWTQLRYYTSAISPYDVLKVYSWGPYPFDLSKAEKNWEQKFRNITGSVSYDSNYDDGDDYDPSTY